MASNSIKIYDDGPSNKMLKILQKPKNSSSLVTLNDDIIDHIISLLPIKEATKTAILSKRFEDSWKYSKHLHFDFKFSNNFSQMDVANIVHRAIMFHSSSKIETFHLSMNSHNYESLIATWLKLVLFKNPKVVDLDFYTESVSSLPLKIHFERLNSESIQILKLSNCLLNLPSTFVGLHFLRTMVLRHLKISSSHVKSIISNCSLLECMDIAKCHTTRNLKIHASGLKFFKMLKVGECSGLFFFEVDAPTLEVFHFIGKPYSMDFPGRMLVLGDVQLNFEVISYTIPRRKLKNFMQIFSHVRVLTITNTVLEDIMSNFIHGENVQGPQLNLCHLEELQLLMASLSICNSNDILNLINRCPNLERLFIDVKQIDGQGDNSNLHEGEDFGAYKKYFAHLNSVKLSNFKFHPLEMKLVKCFLENSPKLKILAIFTMKNDHIPKSSTIPVDYLQQVMSWRSSYNIKVGVHEYNDLEDGVLAPHHQEHLWY